MSAIPGTLGPAANNPNVLMRVFKMFLFLQGPISDRRLQNKILSHPPFGFLKTYFCTWFGCFSLIYFLFLFFGFLFLFLFF